MICIFEGDGVTPTQEALRILAIHSGIEGGSATPGVEANAKYRYPVEVGQVLVASDDPRRPFSENYYYIGNSTKNFLIIEGALILTSKKPVVRITEDDKDYARLVS